MPSSLGDSFGGFTASPTFWYVALAAFLLLFFSTVKVLFGTFSLSTAVSQYRNNNIIKKKYHGLFSTRSNLMFHIGWAQSRGELEQARSLIAQLQKVDQEIDEIESSNPQLFGSKSKTLHRGQKAA